MTARALLALAAALVLAAPAGAVNKCTLAGGKVVYQDDPCPGNQGTRLDVGHAGTAQPPAAPVVDEAAQSAGRMTNAQRIEANTQASMRERRRRDLQRRLVPDARADINDHRDRCELVQQRLRDQQYVYKQNLYGKTHAAQIASEIAAVSAQCDTQDRELVAHFKRLLNECRQLGGCANVN